MKEEFHYGLRSISASANCQFFLKLVTIVFILGSRFLMCDFLDSSP